MATLVGAVTDGVYTKTDASTSATGTGTTTSSSISEASEGTSYDQDMFLQLLVAEMQYQDPLEPTSNTEYVSELASFTQIEAIQAVQSQMETLEANSLVGQYVIMLQDGEYYSGKVDYVYNDGETLYLAINDSLYDIQYLDSVVDEDYYNATITAQAFNDMIDELPDLTDVSLSDESAIVAARTVYDAMDSYTQGFISSSTLSTLTSLESRIKALKEDADSDSTTSDDATDTTE